MQIKISSALLLTILIFLAVKRDNCLDPVAFDIILIEVIVA